jgi:hypothetical protein
MKKTIPEIIIINLFQQLLFLKPSQNNLIELDHANNCIYIQDARSLL